MTTQTLQLIADLVATRAGLQIRYQDFGNFSTLINSRIKALHLSSLQEYYHLLSGTSTLTSSYKSGLKPLGYSAEQEWQVLLPKLTIGESYFFRDTKQFSLLRNTIIPEIMCRKRQTQERSLKVWSAGCSTGEEPYSLAMVLNELIPPEEAWKVQVIGTDLNPESIARAKAGIYTAWSFRQVKPELQQKYFRYHAETWQVIPSIQALVKFSCSNLMQDQVPDPSLNLYEVDLIVCRNVFIYFDAIAIAKALNKFYHCLAPDGYLMTGHTELQGQDIRRFQLKSFSESALYQRAKATPSSIEGSCQLPRELPPLPKVTPPAAGYLRPPFTQSAIAKPKLAEQAKPDRFATLLNQARRYANSGDYQKASDTCHQALQVKPFSVEAHQILAHIAEEAGDFEQVKNLLKKIIYLEPNAVLAYLELATVYEREGQCDRALKCRRSAFTLLKKMPPNCPLTDRDRLTAQHLKDYMQTTWQIND